MLWTFALGGLFAAFTVGVKCYFRFRLARLALTQVPVERRVEVLDAIGRVFERWR
jgi:hypothetical protein